MLLSDACRERLGRLADLLDKEDPKQFDMRWWKRDVRTSNGGCGTSGCAIYTAHKHMPDLGIGFIDYYSENYGTLCRPMVRVPIPGGVKEVYDFRAIALAFDLPDSGCAQELFDLEDVSDECTPRQQAMRIRYFLAHDGKGHIPSDREIESVFRQVPVEWKSS